MLHPLGYILSLAMVFAALLITFSLTIFFSAHILDLHRESHHISIFWWVLEVAMLIIIPLIGRYFFVLVRRSAILLFRPPLTSTDFIAALQLAGIKYETAFLLSQLIHSELFALPRNGVYIDDDLIGLWKVSEEDICVTLDHHLGEGIGNLFLSRQGKETVSPRYIAKLIDGSTET